MAWMIIVLAGLPASGKSTLGFVLAQALHAPILSVDTAEAAMWRAATDRAQPTGLAAYVVVEAVGSELLRLGQNVIVDAVNDAEQARQQWVDLADKHTTPLRFIICSDAAAHRRHVEGHDPARDRFRQPTWSSVQARRLDLELWDEDRLVVDSMEPLSHNLERAIDYVRRAG
jgi:predicted kinase